MNLHYEELAKSGMNLDGVLSMRQLFRFLELHPEEVMPADLNGLSAEQLVSLVFGKLFVWSGEVIEEVIHG